MKKLSLAIAVLALSAGSALSADLPARTYTKAPPMVAPVYDWSGFYLGINGGGGSSHTCWDDVVPAGSIPQGCHNSTGGTAMEVPSPAPTGSSNFATGGSGDESNCCGTSSTRLAQRARAVIFPSVISFSPLCRVMRCRVQ